MSGARSALIVATYQYDDERLRLLNAPERDADALAEVLGDPEIGGFDVQTLVNRSSHEISVRVAEFFAQRRSDDVLLLHFSCHGVKDDSGELFLAATDTRMDLLEATSVSSAYVNRSMTRSRSGCVVLLLDCCYAGAFGRGISRAAATVDVTDRFGGRGRAVITASTALQFAFEGDELSPEGTVSGSPSVFTRALVDGLRTGEADRDADGYVSLDELYAHVHDEVTRVNPDQTPQKWLFDVTGDLHVARRATPVTVPSELPAEVMDSLERLAPWERESAIEPLAVILRGSHPGRALAAKIALERLAAEDDSQRVRQAAQAVLDTWTDPGSPKPVRPPRPLPECPESESPPQGPEEGRRGASPASPSTHPVPSEKPAPQPTARESHTPEVAHVERAGTHSRRAPGAGVHSPDPRQIARWVSLGLAAIALLVLLVLRGSMGAAVNATRGLPDSDPWTSLAWLLPALPIVVACWLIARQRFPGVALGCLAGAWLWVLSTWLSFEWRLPMSTPDVVAKPDSSGPVAILILLLGGVVALVVAAPELRESVHPNSRKHMVTAGVFLVGAVFLRTEAVQIRQAVISSDLSQADLLAPFGAHHNPAVPLWILVPIVIALPATLFLLTPAQKHIFITCAYLAILYEIVLGGLNIAAFPTRANMVYHVVYLAGCVCILLAVRAGQSATETRSASLVAE
jgi:hypothetical protein